MEITDPVSSLLHHKDRRLWTVQAEATVLEAIQVFSEKNIGALPVLEVDRLVGILSERDYTRGVILKGRSSKSCLVRDIMTTEMHCVSPQDTVGACLQVMTERKVRHLPVMEQGRLIGILSIGDLVKWIISAQDTLIDQLEAYIHNSYQSSQVAQ